MGLCVTMVKDVFMVFDISPAVFFNVIMFNDALTTLIR